MSQYISDHSSIHSAGYGKHSDWTFLSTLSKHIIDHNSIYWMGYKRHGVGDLYLNPLSMNHWSEDTVWETCTSTHSQWIIDQKTRCGRLVPQPTLNESLITTVSMEWDTEDTVWEICTPTHSQWIIDHNSIHWMGYRRHGVGDLYPNPLSMNHWSQQYPLHGIQKTWCGRLVPQPTLNESLITTVSIEWDTEDTVWETCTPTHSQWIIDHNSNGIQKTCCVDLYVLYILSLSLSISEIITVWERDK
jgi:hypothetical protein